MAPKLFSSSAAYVQRQFSAPKILLLEFSMRCAIVESAGAGLAGRLGVVDWYSYCRRYEDDQPGGAACADGCIRGAVIA
jgi:hypothetical protein